MIVFCFLSKVPLAKSFLGLILLSLAVGGSIIHAEDWPMWRFDAGRTAASSANLPDQLKLEWLRQYSQREQVWDDPLNHDLMPYDKVFEPIIVGKHLIMGFNDEDKVVALDLDSGAVAWTYYTGGPVRLPPAADKGRVYFTSDDGYLHCVTADAGKPVWSFQGAPSDRKALGNQRLTSAWPARGGPVVKDGQVYFAASIWPFMGTFLYALDAESGEVTWVNDGTGAEFIKQPHSAPSFAGVAPQGALVATDKMLLVPGGRSVPAGFNRATGEMEFFHLNAGGKGNGGSFVAASESLFFVHTRERGVLTYDLRSGVAGRSTFNEPVIHADRFYTAVDNGKGTQVVRELGTSEKIYWEIEADGSGDLILAGDRLYAAGGGKLTAIEMPKKSGDQPGIAWTQPVDGEVLRLLAGRDKLIAVTLGGRIQVFGSGMQRGEIRDEQAVLAAAPEAMLKAARRLVMNIDDPKGFALVFGTDESGLLDALLSETSLQITVVEPKADKVDELRRRYDALGVHGRRITFHVGDPVSFQAPPYFAQAVIFAGDAAGQAGDEAMLKAAFASVRPYGGLMLLPAVAGEWEAASKTLQNAQLEGAEVTKIEGQDGKKIIVVSRPNALPGAADWTHQYGDIGNTVKSDDARVRAPLGILWFGGSSNMDVLPRHGHGPPQQVVSGRLFIQGMNSLSARDVYTGRVIWKHDFGDLGTFGIYYNETYEDAPLSTAYNQKHIPGANGRGSNYVVTEDAVYVAVHGECHVLDPRTGELRLKIPIRPGATDKDVAEWGFIGVLDDVLLGGDDFAHYNLKLGAVRDRSHATIEDYSASDGLVAFDRHTGKELWRMAARHSFLHNCIVAGNDRIYCLDKLTSNAESLLERRGQKVPEDYRVLALDARSGELLWETTEDVFGTFLSYSKQHDVLLQGGAKASDRLSTEVGEGMIAYTGATGKVLWADLKSKYTGPCIIHNELIFTGAGSYQASSGVLNLLDGTPHLVRNPLTGKDEPWRINRAYGCNTIIASEHLLTFRSGAAGFYDLESMSGTGNLGGFKSGCTSNLIAANGVLNAPDYTRTCSCAYQNQTSLALIHMPEMEMWTYSQFGLDGEEGERIERVGINLGAPGDRRANDGTLWLEYPETGDGISPGLEIQVHGRRMDYFRRHSSQVSGEGWNWVNASGLVNPEKLVIAPFLRKPEMKKPPSSKDLQPPPAEEKEPAKVAKVDHPPVPYTVRLHFAEPEDDVSPGTRVFSIKLQGKPVLRDFDPVKEAGASKKGILREFRGVSIANDLTIEFERADGVKAGPVLTGVELIAESLAAAR